jgi:threonine aldolase
MTPEIDLRSDTVTKPSREMREAMAGADVGDDVIGHDPTVEALQEYVADLLGKEAALFMPSGTMTNQIAVRLHCQPGDEFVCEADCHIYNYEQGGFAQLSGVVPRLLQGRHGVLEVEQFCGIVRPDDDHAVRTKLVTIENTHNRGGGTVQPFGTLAAISNWARQSGLSLHLDGARLFNAVAATGVPGLRWAELFDSVSVCFSKGLGAPVGSALAGSKEFVKRAKRARKLFGGGMRQVGIIAAGALHAIAHNRERLSEDHAHAQMLAQAADRASGLSTDPPPETNIVLVRVDPALGSPSDLVSELAARGVGALPFGSRHVRLVTHLDVSHSQIECACQAMEEAATSLQGIAV